MWSLPGLPTEIILEVLTHLPVDSLLMLSRTSHQFNSLCLPYFFSRHNISNPSDVFNSHPAQGCEGWAASRECSRSIRNNDPLSGLITAFQIKSVTELNVEFHECGPKGTSVSRLEPYWKLLRALQRLEHVKELTVGFDHWYLDDQTPLEDELTMKRKQAITDLFNTCLEKGCEYFAIQSSALFLRPALLPKTGLSGFLHSALNPHLFRRGPQRAIIPYAPLFDEKEVDFIPLLDSSRKSSKLRSLMISAPMMLYPPCSYWTYSVLSTPNLTSLTLYQVDFLPLYWEAAFSWLIHPLKNNLLDFNISYCSEVPVKPFLTFLLNLTALTHLDVILSPVPSRIEDYLPLKRRHGTKLLRNLVSLKSYSDWLAILCPRLITRPQLRYLEVMPRGEFDFGKAIPSLRRVLTCPPFLPPNRAPDLRVTLSLLYCTYTPVQFKQNLQVYSDPAHREALGAAIYESVTHLALRPHVFAGFVDTPEVICEFLAWWKHLECVELYVGEVANTWQGTFAGVWTEGQIERLVKEARKRCPLMKTVILNGKEYSICE
ncbi:hypothetical protein BDN72DRAFT_893206 [Pluteus cervinus]|uniref:Uncharacterized protein n=1 Tax=Pluteus cervinus TaxID=181527 RepID=A0ACD3B7V1_9AGAR|nr:hypothetical protein BDN72DRAFT_893206 [Pluteus cervinus]